LKFFSGIFYLYTVLVWILGGLIHLWTVYIAYSVGGLFWGIVSFFFPVISQIYWGYTAWSVDGFNTPYIQWLIAFLVMWLMRFVFAFILAFVDEKLDKDINY
jgi:hypothetical protein